MSPDVIYEDKHFLVVNKPAGLIVHGLRHTDLAQPALTDQLLKEYPELKSVGDEPALRPGIVHRLDKDTSGVMIIARDQATFEYSKTLFQKHEIKKTYLALVVGMLKKEKGTIDAPIGIKNGTTKRSVRSTKMAKPAITDYEVIKIFEGGYSLLKINPQTGRTHQIRVHLASIGHPIVGDSLYGPKKRPEWADRLMLHALSIEFTSPQGKRVKFEAEPPPDFEDVLNSLNVVLPT